MRGRRQAGGMSFATPFVHAAGGAYVHGMALGLGLIVAIGAQNAFVLRQGLRREHVGSVVLFCALADAVLITAGVLGMAQALGNHPSLARALALDPELLFLDEPTAGLDPIGASHYDELVKGLSRNLGLTVLMVTHDLDSLNAICDRIAVLLDKRVVVGTMAELLEYDHPWVREYFHGPRGRAARREQK